MTNFGDNVINTAGVRSLSLSLPLFVRPAVRQIWMNTAGVRRMKCGVQSFVTPAVGLRLIFEINFILTAGVRRMKFGVNFVTSAD